MIRGALRHPSIVTMCALASVFALSSCGGGGGDGGGSSGGGGAIGNGGDWQAGVYPASDTLDAKCAAPRTGTDPETGRPFVDTQGTARDEKNWIRSWSRELYLWYSELPDVNPANNTSVLAYFDTQKTTAITASGKPKDDFHFTYPTSEWLALSESGISAGYGLTWSVVAATPPRNIVIAYTELAILNPSNPISLSRAISRGSRVLSIDGIDIDSNTAADINAINAALYPDAAGVSHSFTLRRTTGTIETVTLTSRLDIVISPVRDIRTITTATGPVGYVLFNDHVGPAEGGMVTAINNFISSGVQDLVLDLRYNGGGFLDIAREVGYMIGGANVSGRTFEALQFNDKYPSTNPVTGAALTPLLFATTTQGFSGPAGTALPTLNLSRVYILSGPDTCSASESIINALRGVNVEVILIGSPTCGKPYGFYPTDNCGTTYFTIQFRGVNSKNFGDYADGFTPTTTGYNDGRLVRGCRVADDFTRALGDPAEARLAAALQYRATGLCPAASATIVESGTGNSAHDSLGAVDGRVNKSPWLENRIMRQ